MQWIAMPDNVMLADVAPLQRAAVFECALAPVIRKARLERDALLTVLPGWVVEACL
jgi:hypothetical protein